MPIISFSLKKLHFLNYCILFIINCLVEYNLVLFLIILLLIFKPFPTISKQKMKKIQTCAISALLIIIVSSFPLAGKPIADFDNSLFDKFPNSLLNVGNSKSNRLENNFNTDVPFEAYVAIPDLFMDVEGDDFNEGAFDELCDDAENVKTLDPSLMVQLPIGITTDFGICEAQIVVVSAYFFTDYMMLNVIGRVTWNGKNASGGVDKRILRLGAWNVKYYYDFGFQGNAKLVLLQDLQIPISQKGSNLILKGNFNQNSGEVDYSKACYLNFGCNGVESMEGHFIGTLSFETENALVKHATKGADGKLTADDELLSVDFETTCSLDNFYFSTSLGLFTISDTDVFFEVNDLTVDLSTVKSNPKLTNDDGALWEGFYVDQFTVYMPKSFGKREDGNQERVSASIFGLSVNESGITGEFLAENLTTLENGVAGEWPFAISLIDIKLEESELKSLAFAGEFRPPVLSDNSSVVYSGSISENEISVKVDVNKTKEKLELDIFFAELKISSANLSITKREDQPDLFWFNIKGGSFSLKSEKLKDFGVEFEEFTISNEPKLAIKILSPDKQETGDRRLSNFPITIGEFKFETNQLDLGMNINLMQEKIAGDLNVSIFTKSVEVNGRQKWRYDGLKINDIGVKAEFDKFSINGSVSMFETQTDKGFSGKLDMGLELSEESIGLKVAATFGTKNTEIEDFRYWYIDIFANGFRVPLFTGVEMSGIGGAAANHMIVNTDGSLTADSRMGLFFRVNTELLLLASSASNPSQVALEMQFKSDWTLMYVQLFGEVNLAPSIGSFPGASELLAGYKSICNKAVDIQNKILAEGESVKFTQEDFAGRISSLTTAQVKIQLLLNMDFESDILTGKASTFFNAANILKGNASGGGGDGNAGSVYMVFRKNEWFVHAGYKYYKEVNGLPAAKANLIESSFDPLRISLMAKNKSLADISAYLLLGHHIPELPYPGKDLGISSFPDDVLDKHNSVKRGASDTNLEGAGLAFGAAAQLKIDRLRYLILYVDLSAYLGFDVLLKNYDKCICGNWDENEEFGINNWYAQGQAYAGLDADVGVYVKLFGKSKQLPAFHGKMDILLQAKLPNPTWFSGTLSGSYSALGGAVSGSFDMNCSFGDECEIVDNEISDEALELEIVNHVWPAEDELMSPIDMPIVFFNYEFDTPFSIDDTSNGDEYMLAVEKISGSYVGEQTELNLKSWWSTRKKMYIDFEKESEIWNGNTDVVVTVHYCLKQKIDGQWVVATEEVNNITEEIRGTQEILFKTKERPDVLGYNAIVDMYPAIDQDCFYIGPTKTAFIKINPGFQYLFKDNGKVLNNIEALFSTDNSSNTIACSFDEINSQLNYTLPELENNKTYNVDLFAGKDKDRAKLLSFEFHTSQFNTFAEKISKIGSIISRPDVLSSQIMFSYQYDEPFGREEIIGNNFMNGGAALVSANLLYSSIVQGSFVSEFLNLIYDDHPYYSLFLFEKEKAMLEAFQVYNTNWGIMEHEMESESTFPFAFLSFNPIKSDFDRFGNYISQICNSNTIEYNNIKSVVEKYKITDSGCDFNFPLNESAYTFPLKLTYSLGNIMMSNLVNITYNP